MKIKYMSNLPSTNTLNSKKITISAIIATFNGEKYVLELLESIASQTHRVDEIVVVMTVHLMIR